MRRARFRLIDKLKFLIPIIILILGVGFIFFFEFYVKDKVNTVAVVVADNTIGFKEKISIDDLTIKNISKGNDVEGSFRPDELNYIVGKFAAIEISKGTQIYSQLIDTYDLIPDESKGEFVAPIPNQWLFAVPGSLRRSYVADIYAIGTKEQALLESFNKDNPNSDVNDKIIKSTYQPLITDIRIASVKDSGNKEIKTTDEDLQSGTGKISELEIIATEEILTTLRKSTEKGNQLYIVYKYERSSEESSKKGESSK